MKREKTQKDSKKVSVSSVLAYFFEGGGVNFNASKKRSLYTTVEEPFVLIIFVLSIRALQT